MKKLAAYFNSDAFFALVLMLSAFGTVCYYGGRFNWVFLDLTVGIEKFTFFLLYAMVINIILLATLLYIRLKYEKLKANKAIRIVSTISVILGAIFSIAGTVYSAALLVTEASESLVVFFTDSIFKALFFSMLPFFSFFYPFLKGKIKAFALISAAVVISVLLFNELCPILPYEFTSKPSVLNTGSDYSVVFSTNDYGTGYVEYDFEGKHYKVFDENGGRLNTDSKIHSISVPYEHLENNTYIIGSVRVLEQYSYGSRTGKEIVSEEFIFDFEEKEEMTYLVVSDWHTYLDEAYDAVSYVGSYDAVILLGDSSPGIDYEQQVIDNIVEFSGELTCGSKPLLYVRGNHETRGEYAGKLLDALGLSEFYYSADIGDVSFLVLDSGEDKEDAHPEYGGMNDYNTYRTDMIDWLSGVDVDNNNVIVLSHSWKISDVEKELSEKGWSEIDRLGASLIISGHTHQCRLIGETETEKEVLSNYPEITGFMDGGHSSGKYIASKMIVGGEALELSSYSNTGEKVFEHSLNWR